MPNMSLKKVEMPVQDPMVRRANFEEVALGYTAEMAREEAERCLHCPTKPCVSGCPVSVNIPEFIKAVKEGDPNGSYMAGECAGMVKKTEPAKDIIADIIDGAEKILAGASSRLA